MIIDEKIFYDSHKFKLDNHHSNNYPKILNYRYINYRKNEIKHTLQFCNVLVKRKIEKDILIIV